MPDDQVFTVTIRDMDPPDINVGGQVLEDIIRDGVEKVYDCEPPTVIIERQEAR